jgi:hypothetical protein
MMRTSKPPVHSWPEKPQAVELALRGLPSYLVYQRWYPAKAAGLPIVSLECLIPLASATAAAVAIWSVTPPGQPSFRVFLPLALVPPNSIETEQSALIGQLNDCALLVDAFASDRAAPHGCRPRFASL